jgi:hypothetical protein
MGMQIGGNIRVYLLDVDITDHVRSITIEDEESSEIIIRAVDLVDLGKYIGAGLHGSGEYPAVAEIKWSPSRDRPVDQAPTRLMEGSVRFSGGQEYAFGVYQIVSVKVGGSTWYDFMCDACPPIPDGLIHFDGRPVRFRSIDKE